jgi:RHS repeat-associated protein
MAAKRRALWQVIAAHALLVTVPLYGSLPELSELAARARSSRLVDESELATTHALARANARSLAPALVLVALCEVTSAKVVGAEKPLYRGRTSGDARQPQEPIEVRCEIASGDCVWRNAFTYDPVGNRTRQDRVETTGTSRTVNYGYDERDRLLSESSTDSTAYGWDENGNLISKSGTDGAVYEWDFDNRLTKVTLTNGTVVEHAYDPDGTRVRTTTTPAGGPAELVDYLVDSTGLSQVVAESNGVGTVTALHVRGDDLLATLRPNGTDWSARYFHAEGIGSIRALTDEMGGVSSRYAFEAHGELTARDGVDENSILFAGESLDPASGWYYLRARWLQATVGAFSSADTFAGAPTYPSSLHKYLYAGARPSDSIDPSGMAEFSTTGLLTTMGVGAIIGAIATPIYLHALGKPTTFRDIIAGAAIGAVAAGAAALSSVLAGGLLVVGIYGSGALVWDVYADPGSTWTQKVAASALLLAAVAGGSSAARYSTRLWNRPTALNRARVLHDIGADELAAFYRARGFRVQREVYVRNPHYKVGRRYDLVVETANKEFIGIEYKGTTSALRNQPARQVRADGWINEHGGQMFGTAAEEMQFAGQAVTKVIRLGPSDLPPAL